MHLGDTNHCAILSATACHSGRPALRSNGYPQGHLALRNGLLLLVVFPLLDPAKSGLGCLFKERDYESANADGRRRGRNCESEGVAVSRAYSAAAVFFCPEPLSDSICLMAYK